MYLLFSSFCSCLFRGERRFRADRLDPFFPRFHRSAFGKPANASVPGCLPAIYSGSTSWPEGLAIYARVIVFRCFFSLLVILLILLHLHRHVRRLRAPRFLHRGARWISLGSICFLFIYFVHWNFLHCATLHLVAPAARFTRHFVSGFYQILSV